MKILAAFLIVSAVTAAPPPSRQTASSWVSASQIPLPPENMRGRASATPVFFEEQDAIDHLCGGKDQVIACAVIGGGGMALPNPCQDRFRGESYAAIVCHEKGHTLGWNHGG